MFDSPPAVPHAMLLDLDDTIVDYSSGADAAWRTVCDAAAAQVPGLDASALRATIARIGKWFWADPDRHREGRADLRAASSGIVERSLTALGYDLPRLAQALAHQYRDLRERMLCLLPGSVDALARLRAAGVRLGLVTNGAGPDQRAKIERFDLARHFDHILIEGEFGCGKPDARVYFSAMQALRARPESTWCVGDNLEWEVAAPQRLGLYAIWVDATRAGLPAGSTARPDRIIHTLGDLL